MGEISAMTEIERPKGPSIRKVPEGDNRERLTCPDCGFVQYDNPKIVVGSVVRWHDRVLLCRRSIPPRRGFWTLPAGYLELNETTAEGALREAYEEARARIVLDGILAVYNIPRLSQVQIIYRAHLVEPDFAPGPESEAVELFGWDQVPWDALAFPSVKWALDHWREVGEAGDFAARGNPAGQLGNFGGL